MKNLTWDPTEIGWKTPKENIQFFRYSDLSLAAITTQELGARRPFLASGSGKNWIMIS